MMEGIPPATLQSRTDAAASTDDERIDVGSPVDGSGGDAPSSSSWLERIALFQPTPFEKKVAQGIIKILGALSASSVGVGALPGSPTATNGTAMYPNTTYAANVTACQAANDKTDFIIYITIIASIAIIVSGIHDVFCTRVTKS